MSIQNHFKAMTTTFARRLPARRRLLTCRPTFGPLVNRSWSRDGSC